MTDAVSKEETGELYHCGLAWCPTAAQLKERSGRYGKDCGPSITLGELATAIVEAPTKDARCAVVDDFLAGAYGWWLSEMDHDVRHHFMRDIRGVIHNLAEKTNGRTGGKA